MRVYLIVLLCLALGTCSSQVPQARILNPAGASLAGLYHYQLIPAQQPGAERAECCRQLPELLRQGLSDRGYRETHEAPLRIYYSLAFRNEARADLNAAAAAAPTKPRELRLDEPGTLRLRLADQHEHTLWEGLISTGLGATRNSPEALERAALALVRQIPEARP